MEDAEERVGKEDIAKVIEEYNQKAGFPDPNKSGSTQAKEQGRLYSQILDHAVQTLIDKGNTRAVFDLHMITDKMRYAGKPLSPEQTMGFFGAVALVLAAMVEKSQTNSNS